jgi:hypothetical protein
MKPHHSSAPSSRRPATPALRILALAALVATATGCTTRSLDSARTQFYSGQFHAAEQTIDKVDPPAKAKVLHYMERGMIRQAAGHYEASTRDFIEAFNLLESMTAISVSEDTASLVINDSVQDYRGAPYERTLLHTFSAVNHLAIAHFENAAVEARRIINSLSPEAKGDYPDDAFSRYMAGFCLEMMDDRSNASLQYRKANDVSGTVYVDEGTGRMSYKAADSSVTNATAFTAEPVDTSPWPAELVCFVFAGRSPHGETVSRPYAGAETYAEIYAGGKMLGRSYILADTVDLAFTTEQKEAIRKMVKTAARIAAKETISYQIEQNNELLGALVRLVLIGFLEQPDVRRWETLPRWLQVARVPCPPDLKEFEVVFRNTYGVETRRVTVTHPLIRRRATFVSFCRDIVPRGSAPGR